MKKKKGPDLESLRLEVQKSPEIAACQKLPIV